MESRYPNVQHVVQALAEGSLARALCACFVGVESPDEAEAKLRLVLETRLVELRETEFEEGHT